MTREEAIQKHRQMWSWLADNPGLEKEDYLEKFDPEANLECNCYLCEYVIKRYHDDCECCPVEWPDGGCTAGGLYNTWVDSMIIDDYANATKIARQIAELPEREDEA